MKEQLTPLSEANKVEVEKAIAIMRTAEKRILDKENKDIEKDIQRLSGTLTEFLEKNGAHKFEAWQDKMREIVQANPSLLIRRENPEPLLSAIANEDPLKIEFSAHDAHAEEAYPNAAELGTDLEGLKIPATAGFGSLGGGAVIFMIGFKPGKDMKIDHLPKDKFGHYQGPDRARVRMVSGEVPFENIRFVLCRFPYHLFPKDEMTDQEIGLAGDEDGPARKKKPLPPITRLYSFNG